MIATWFGAQWSGMASRFSFDQFHSIGQACAAAGVVKDGQEDGPEDHKDQEKPPKEKVKKG